MFKGYKCSQGPGQHVAGGVNAAEEEHGHLAHELHVIQRLACTRTQHGVMRAADTVVIGPPVACLGHGDIHLCTEHLPTQSSFEIGI